MVGNGLLHNRRLRPYHIQTYRTQIWRGEEVYYEPEFPNIVFAKDGEIYDLDGKKAITIGGAYSRDKEYIGKLSKTCRRQYVYNTNLPVQGSPYSTCDDSDGKMERSKGDSIFKGTPIQWFCC